ncbi:MAG: alanine dehydrogenase [Gammaproteobacteria bacterium]
MKIGVPKEIKIQENRVGLVPDSVQALISQGHEVWVETKAGHGIGISDADYQALGAHIAKSPQEIFENAQLIVKVKEPQPSECAMLTKDHILFTFLHLASDREQTELLLKSNCIAIAYETITDDKGALPLLRPMSDIAGRMSIQVGAHYLEEPQGGRGVLLSHVSGIAPAHIVIIGAGSAGLGAIQVASCFGAKVTVIDKSSTRLEHLNQLFPGKLNTVLSSQEAIAQQIKNADLVIGAVLVPGAAAPRVITREMLRTMQPRAVIVDIAIDQGGCFETSKPTTHEHPTYIEENIIHYCVTNMPGAVPRTSSFALNHATLPFVLALANKGFKQALSDDPHFLAGLNIFHGEVTYKAVAEALGYPLRIDPIK